MAENAAIYIRDAYKSYGKKEILKGLSMTVHRGSIYGLLGASGCGKTTLLSCTVGRKLLNSGDIFVLGSKPGAPGSGVPGNRIGYMPQEVALVGEFTVEDALFYFGRLAGMEEDLIKERTIELCDLLELPPRDRYVKNCSGGQQRRVSFASAMIHMPELLILDEPTVGVDPVLRDKIWGYLVELSQKYKTAIIITTHYIEETRQANAIGLMRGGKLLAEASPTRLLNAFNTDSLEHVFLLLSRRQEEGTLETLEALNSSDDVELQRLDAEFSGEAFIRQAQKDEAENKNKPQGLFTMNPRRFRALLDKNSKQLYRNKSAIAFLGLFPIMECLAFFLAVGGDIKNISLAVVNKESCQNFTNTNVAVPYGYMNCHFKDLSCVFLKYLNNPMLDLHYIDDFETGLSGVKHGKYVGVVYFADNFTDSVEDRFNLGKDIEDEVIKFSEIQIYMDMSNRQIGATVKYKLFDLYLDYQKEIFRECKFEPKLSDPPVKIYDPIFGKKEDSFTVFMVPGVILTVIYFLTSLMTSQIIVGERIEGVWDRSAVAGVTAVEITLSHFLVQILAASFQVVEILLITFYVFQIENMGSYLPVSLIALLQALCGMCSGFLVSVISYNQSMANILATGSFYPMIVLCGLVWPLEAMPQWLRFISNCLPFTIPIGSLRNTMKKGWGLESMQVLDGIGVEVLWISLATIASIYFIRVRQ